MVPAMNDRWYLSQKAAATLLGVRPGAVRALIERGELETVQLESKRWVLTRSVQEYLARVGAERAEEPEHENGTVA